jgi:hypothetical protein
VSHSGPKLGPTRKREDYESGKLRAMKPPIFSARPAGNMAQQYLHRARMFTTDIDVVPSWGPKMLALANDKQRAFVCALFMPRPRERGH